MENITGLSPSNNRYRAADSADDGYAVYIGEDALPDFTAAPTQFSATLPIAISITPPGAGTKTLNVVVRRRNSYGLESQNQFVTQFVVDTNGDLVRNPVPAPLGVTPIAVASGGIKVLAKYPTVADDVDPADKWRIWTKTTPPVPASDPVTKEVTVAGQSLTTTVTGPHAAGLWYVTVGLYRTVDTTLSDTVETTLTVPDDPDRPDPVRSGFQVEE